MFTLSPELWSAVAASFAALSSFLVMFIQHANRLDAARPELVLTGWTRTTRGEGEAAHEVLTFQTIRNVGKGPAIHVVLNCAHCHENRPTATMSTTRLPILAPAEAHDINGEIVVWWKNVPREKDGLQHLFLTVTLASTDSIKFRHETEYQLLAVPLSPAQGVADAIAPGVMLYNRTTRTTHLRRLRLHGVRGQMLERLRSLFKWSAK